LLGRREAQAPAAGYVRIAVRDGRDAAGLAGLVF
jgi:hypothetical protein